MSELVSGVIPPLPPERGYESSATVELRPRYEDIAQDGRVQLTSLVPGLSAVWRALSMHESAAKFGERGVLPILHRAVMIGEPGPFSMHRAMQASGTWRLARETNGERIFLDMWLEVRAPHASTWGDTSADDAPLVLVGRVYASHVFTRPFGPPGDRRVTRLEAPGVPPIPEDHHEYAEAAVLLKEPLEPSGDHVFGMMHTDSNQHVNSLVYPRIFEEAVVRKLLDRVPDGRPESRRAAPQPLSRVLEIRWRKPFFAGERAAIGLHLGASETGGGIDATGAFFPHGSPIDGTTKPSTAIALGLS